MMGDIIVFIIWFFSAMIGGIYIDNKPSPPGKNRPYYGSNNPEQQFFFQVGLFIVCLMIILVIP